MSSVILAPYITRNHEIYNGSGEVSCTSFLSHINGQARKGCLDEAIYMVKVRTSGPNSLPKRYRRGHHYLRMSMMDCRGCPEQSIIMVKVRTSGPEQSTI